MEMELVAPQPPSHLLRFGGVEMGNQMTQDEINNHMSYIQNVVGQRNIELLDEGARAYRRELPQLLHDQYDRQLVAYRGHQRLAIARSERKLNKILAKNGHTKRSELYITSITPLDLELDECPGR